MKAGLRRGAVVLVAANGVAKPLWFAYIAVLCVRHLSPYQFGLLATALGIGQIVGALVDMGLTPHAVREAAASPSRAGELLRHLLPARALLVLVGVGAAGTIGALLGQTPDLRQAVAFGVLYSGTLALRGFMRAFLEAQGRLEPEGGFLILERGLVVAAGVVVLMLTERAVPVLAAMTAAMLAVTLAQGLWTMKHLPLMSGTAPKAPESLRSTVEAAAPLALASALGLLYYRSDIVVIEAMLGAKAAGLYGAPYQLLNGLGLLPTIVVGSILYPRLSKLHGQRELASFERLLWRSMAALIATGGIVAAGTSSLADPIMTWTGGVTYAASGAVLEILAWTFPFNCSQYLLSVAAMAARRTTHLNVVLGTAFAVNVSANLLLLPRFGIAAAAGVTVASEALVTVLLAAGLQRYLTLERLLLDTRSATCAS